MLLSKMGKVQNYIVKWPIILYIDSFVYKYFSGRTYRYKKYKTCNKKIKIPKKNTKVRKTQIQNTMRYHFTPARMAIIKKTTNI